MKIGLENFRVFKDYTEFDIKPITVLTGPNNSGKSAVGKILYLLENGFKKDKYGDLDLTKLYFTENIIKEVGDFNDNMSRGSGFDYLYIELKPENSQGLIGHKDFTYTLKFRAPKEQINLNYAIIEEIRVLYQDKLIFQLDCVPTLNYPDLFEEEESKNKVCYVSKHHNNPKIISNLRHFLIQEIQQHEDFLRDDETNGENWSSAREKMSIASTDFGKKNEFLFQSHFGKIVLNDPNFFVNSEHKSKYTGFIKYILDEADIMTHADFIQTYNGFEHQYLNSILDEYFKIIPVEYEVSSSDLMKKMYDKKLTIKNIDKIKNPLAKLFLLEAQTKQLTKDPNTSIYEEFIPIVESFEDEVQDEIFELEQFMLIASLKYSLLNLNNFRTFEIQFYNQKQAIQDHYIKDELSNKNSTFYNFGTKYNNNEITIESKNFVDKWIKNLGIGDKLVIEPIKVKNKAIGTSFFLKEGKNEYQLKDNGFGINKILQILLEIASFEAIDYNKLNFKHQLSYDSLNERVDLKKILLLEEPESNLHPSYQSKLAEIFAEAITLFGINILVETHSEYLIRKLQFLIASDESKLKSNDISVYYMQNPKQMVENSPQVYKLDIREDGFMNNDFGKGFFDEASTLSLGLLNLKNFN